MGKCKESSSSLYALSKTKLSKGEREREKVGCQTQIVFVFGLAYQGKDIVFRFIIEYSSSLRDFYRPLGNK
jgi:hypothetical protein